MAKGEFEYRDGIAVIQVVFFSIFLCFAIWFKKSGRNGWFCIGVMSLFRVIGGACMLALIKKNSDGLWAVVLVAESIGMLLMMFLLLELLQRVNDGIGGVVQKKIFYIPQLITWAGIGVSIAGFVAIARNEDALAPTPYSRAGTALTAVIYLCVVGIFVALWLKRTLVPGYELLAFRCVQGCLPMLAVRIIYSLLYVITANKEHFHAVIGNPTIYLLMTTVPEITIIGLCTWTIMKIRPPPKKEGGAEEQSLRRQQSIPLVNARDDRS